MLLHGRHVTCHDDKGAVFLRWPCAKGEHPVDSYLGYNYLAEYLVRHGFIVVSISANGINAADSKVQDGGAAARAELMQRHLDLLHQMASQGGPPFGSAFVGKIDFTRIGTMGHSRGGEGVVAHYWLNKKRSSGYTIRAVLPLAPVNFTRMTIPGVPLGVVLPYCDGDVTSLDGVHYYDDARYAVSKDLAAKHYALMIGANHNYFNTVWSRSAKLTGGADDWSGYHQGAASDPHCGDGPSSGRFTEQKQREVGGLYMATFFRAYVKGEAQLLPFLTGAKSFPSLKGDEIANAYLAPDDLRFRLDLNRLANSRAMTVNDAGGAVHFDKFATADMCGGTNPSQYCLPAGPSEHEPHTYGGKHVNLNQLRLGWVGASAKFINILPEQFADVSRYSALEFRVGLNYADPRNQSSARDFTVLISDRNNRQARVSLSQFSRALQFPRGRLLAVPRVVLTTARLPLEAFRGVDLTRVKSVEFVFDASPSGAVLVSDIAFVVEAPETATSVASVSTTDSTEAAAAEPKAERTLEGEWLIGESGEILRIDHGGTWLHPNHGSARISRR